MAREIELFIKKRAGGGDPSQIHFIQRAGSTLNLHVHVHAVVSDGVFFERRGALGGKSLGLRWTGGPNETEVLAIVEAVRRKIMRRFVRLGVLPEEVARDMLAWVHSGFSLHTKVRIGAQDRDGLERLLSYCARPALSEKRLSYRPKQGLVVSRAEKRKGEQVALAWEPVEFLRRWALLAPPRLRKKREGIKQAVGAKLGSWAACLARVFEVDPLECRKCGKRMIPVAVIMDDVELVRAREPEIVANFARDYRTGAPMPKALLDRVVAAQAYGEGYGATEYLAAAMLDQAWHQIAVSSAPLAAGVAAFEAAALKKAGMAYAPVPPRYHTAYFAHAFSGGYAAGYYAYIWSEVLARDTGAWFHSHGGISRANGDFFRAKILSRGRTMEPGILFEQFYGKKPDVGPLLEYRGLALPTAKPKAAR